MLSGSNKDRYSEEMVNFEAPQEQISVPENRATGVQPTPEIQESRTTSRVSEALETSESLSAIDAQFGLESEPGSFVTTHQAAEILTNFPEKHPEYSVEQAEREKPYTHYTHAGNIFQILRYGIQSGNFKNRLNGIRSEDSAIDAEAKNINGLRHKQGASYQEPDSISLAKYPSCPANTQNIVFLINPDCPVFGEREPREKTGYGHGIGKQVVAGEYQVGNPTAYQDEVLGVNIILPADLRAVVVEEGTSLTYRLKELVREIVPTAKRKSGFRVEDILATPRLIAELSGAEDLVREIDSMCATKQAQDVEATTVIELQSRALKAFVGKDVELTDASLLSAIKDRFGITVISKKRNGTNRLEVPG